MVGKADKSKTCVIIYTDKYNEKFHNSLNENNFQKLQKDPHGQIPETYHQDPTT